MRGKPKFKIGDKVIISLKMSEDIEPKDHIGEIYIIDEYGTWDDPSDVSYDVMIHDYVHPSTPDKIGDCLVKHNTEKTVRAYSKENAKDKKEI